MLQPGWFVSASHLRYQRLEQGVRLPPHAAHGEAYAATAALHDPRVPLVAVAGPRQHRPHLLHHGLARVGLACGHRHVRVPALNVRRNQLGSQAGPQSNQACKGALKGCLMQECDK